MDAKVTIIISINEEEITSNHDYGFFSKRALKDFEFILIDFSGSNNISKGFKNTKISSERIKYINANTKDKIKTKNNAIKIANGEYLLFASREILSNIELLKKIKKILSKCKVEGCVLICEEISDNLSDQNSNSPLFLFNTATLKKKQLQLNENLNSIAIEDLAFRVNKSSSKNHIIRLKYSLAPTKPNRKKETYIYYEHKVDEILQNFFEFVENNYIEFDFDDELNIMIFDVIFYKIYKYITSCRYNIKNKQANTIVTFSQIYNLPEELWVFFKKIKSIKNNVYFPEVSIIIPVYNSEKYLDETLMCLVRQNFLNYEIIFVDDGSNDKSVEIIKKYLIEDSRSKLLQQKHSNAGTARNNGLKESSGDYVIFLDSDDLYNEKLVEYSYYRIIETNADICVFMTNEMNDVTKNIKHNKYTCDFSKQPPTSTFSRKTNEHIISFTTAVPWNKIYKKNFLIDNNLLFQDTINANDIAFVVTSLCIANRIATLNKELVTYRNNNSNSLQGKKDNAPYEWYKAHIETKQRLIHYGVYPEVKRAFENYQLDSCLYNLWSVKNPAKQEELYSYIKQTVLPELNFEYKSKEYFSLYDKSIYEKMKNIESLDYSEYAKKYGVIKSKELESIETEQTIRNDRLFFNNQIKRTTKRLKKSYLEKLAKLYNCYKDNGFKYTIIVILYHLHLVKDNDPFKNGGINVKNYEYYSKISEKKYKKELKCWYKNVVNQNLNLSNPLSFNEKIQWLKLYDSTSKKTELSDNYLVKDWIKTKIDKDYIIPMLGVWNSFDDIDFNSLPSEFVLKASHGPECTFVITNKSMLSIIKAKRRFDIWMKKNFAFENGFELQYKNIIPKIIAEEYIVDQCKKDLIKYIIFCFNGEPKFIKVINKKQTENKTYENQFDINWKSGDYLYRTHSFREKSVKKPKNLKKMIDIAKRASENFPFVAIELYLVNEKIYFKRMDFTPESGVGVWSSETKNKQIGELISIKK